MNTKFLIFAAAFLLVAPFAARAQAAAPGEALETFEARVVEIVEERSFVRENGGEAVQQDLRLEITSAGPLRGSTVEHRGVSDLDVVGAQSYAVGDRVVVQKTSGPEGEDSFVVVDSVRRFPLYLLALLFTAASIAVGGWKGLRALLALAVSFVVIIKMMLPAILSGRDPLAVGLVGSITVIAVIMYLTEGWRRKSHVAVVSVALSLAVTLVLSVAFSAVARLSGMMQEETMFLIDAARSLVDFRGLLLAGFMVGTVGVLDDIVVSQVEAVEQLRAADPRMPLSRLFSSAYKIGSSHFGAVVNTLFLTYAGASLPLLLLFSVHQEPFVTFSAVLNNELVATEVVRTLVGSLGVAAAMPVSTVLACLFLNETKPEQASS